MIEICPEEKCTGCAACMNVCPKDAISMQEKGVMGYVHPYINQDKCIDCHLCEKICPVNNPVDLSSPQKAYAAISNDEQDLMSSTSGGASSVFVQTILQQGGVVYGCVQKNYKDISHCRINNIDEAFQLKGSKYVQSNIGYIYRQVKKDLVNGVPVLFTGTPCQIAGLRNYLKKPYDNLYLVDLVCHGVPSQKLLQENVRGMLKKKESLASVTFRKKGKTLKDLKFGVFINDNSISLKKQLFPKNNYIAAFMTGIIFRKNCFSCTYAQSSRASDVTIADFWGIGRSAQISNNKGLSLILVNTDKGQRLLSNSSRLLQLEERPVEEAIMGNGQLQSPSLEPNSRNDFIKLYETNSKQAYSKFLKEYRRNYKRQQLKLSLISYLQRHQVLYKFLKKIRHILG